MKTQKILQIIILSGLILGGGFIAGCGGPDTEIRQQQITTTLGQELIDLDTAYKKLEEGIRKEKIPAVKIYLDGMIREATAIHTTYPEYLNSEVRNQIFKEGLIPVPCRLLRLC